MYEKFYGFKGNPFLLTPDARFFFPSRNHKRALSFLRYGVGKGEGFVVITGDVGTGKSTVVQMLLRSLRDKPVSVANIVTTQLSDHELLRLVAANFNLRFREFDKVELIKGLEAYFLDCARQGKRVLLIIDEAQNLPPESIEELRMLSNLQHEGRPLIQTFLLGQSQLRARIATSEFEQLRQRITAVFHLGPLDVDETRDYILHRLGCVDWDNDPALSNAAFLEIHRFTKGVPRRINNVCDRTLLFAYLEELHKIDESTVKHVLQEITTETEGLEPDPDAVNDLAPVNPEATAVPAGAILPTVTSTTEQFERLNDHLVAIHEALSNIAGELRLLREGSGNDPLDDGLTGPNDELSNPSDRTAAPKVAAAPQAAPGISNVIRR